ncbi:MAG: cobyrinate a,c-diamide synthase [Nostocaceae cyanobacterium]|nr:cobyrinate a,c-diamide synthase [Nostocaceae cyanobacterium]
MALIIAGERSGVGKTTVTLTLLASLCRRQTKVQSFKVGPDYIDPMFHQYVTRRPCRNLDPVLTSEAYVQQCFARHSKDVDYTLVEGVMGLFDGVATDASLTDETDRLFVGVTDKSSVSSATSSVATVASTAHIARLLNLPVVLVVDCSRLSGSVAAIVHGYRSLDPRINLVGVVLNRVGSDRQLSLLQNALLPLQIPILGVLRRQDNITIPDRHLGLIPTAELPELDALINRLADLGDACFDWERLLPLLETGDKGQGTRDKGLGTRKNSSPVPNPHQPIRVAVARDRAFNFYYQDNLDLLQELGAQIVFWSPLQDAGLPEGVQGMYFGGGFPEVFAQQLADNKLALDSVKTAILSGIPTIAECGGLMYLCAEIVDFQGKAWSMVGILSTTAVMSTRLSLGYRRALALHDSPLVKTGELVYGHEFHRSVLLANTDKPLFQTYRFDCDEATGDEGWCSHLPLHASYVHLHWGERPQMVQRFLRFCGG